jgi:iron complex outermembrane recepter protein
MIFHKGKHMQIRYFLAASATALSVAAVSTTAAHAQSTGSIDFEEEIVVTATKSPSEVAGVQVPDATKAKAVLTQEFIERQNPGQTILDTINQIPGVSFQNNDAYGSAGGTLTIRGFDSSRISLTFDGVPLNDSGNYSIFSNQQLDPELIEQVNVNLGTTDVDSPTASAVGGTVNYRTMVPTKDFGVKLSGSYGEFDFMRIFAMVNTGELNASGTRAFFALSRATNDVPFNNIGGINKQQYNARIYQPIGADGDFISLSGHYNQNRNNNFGSAPLRFDPTRVAGPGAGNRFPTKASERFNFIPACTTQQNAVFETAAQVAATGYVDPDGANTCGTEFDRRWNPSNTGNLRGASKFSFGESLTLTVDPSYQYVKANGGTSGITAREGRRDVNPAGATVGSLNNANCTTVTTGAGVDCQVGYLAGTPFFGRDLNGDGDALDTVTIWAPSQTQTRRIGVISSLRYDLNEENTLRLSYTYDRAKHRQTGEVGPIQSNGVPVDVFPINIPLNDVNGSRLEKRDRLSYAILHQVSAEYRGEFLDNNLTVSLGGRLPFFRRNLTNNCFTSSASGNVECFGIGGTIPANYAAQNPTFAAPQKRVYDYNKFLPNVGLTYKFTPQFSTFASYAKSLSVPGTDSLYSAFFFALNNARANPVAETSDSFDLGLRYRSGIVQAQLSGWLTKYQNRLATAYDPDLDQNVFRNLGDVDKYGLDGSISVEPIKELSLYVFGSWNNSEIKDNVAFGENTDGTPIFANTAGKKEAGAPRYSFGGTVRASLGPVDLGLTGKRTGGRFLYDTNEEFFTGTFVPLGAVPTGVAGVGASTAVFGNKTPAYWLVNLDARVNLEFAGLNKQSFSN